MSEAGAPALEPRIIAFACEYCSYAAADLAGSLRLRYPAGVRVVRLPCTGRSEPVMILRALEEGADAVFVSGCQPGDCHFQGGNLRARAMVPGVKGLLEEVGLHPDRVEFFHVGAPQARLWVEVVEEMSERVVRLGPNPLRTGGGPECGPGAGREKGVAR